jgi:2-polyprenyl-3-methyl-5-hydroxy-6-metoxy-1,4-benzoquinol methylase
MPVTRPPSRDAAHFQRIYEADPDPWRFRSSPYEQAKYRRTIGALGGRRFRAGLEVGCSIGVLTRMLARHCDSVLGVDLIERALAEARRTCEGMNSVSFVRMQVPAEWPAGRFDLVVLSEVLYFLSPEDVAATADRVLDSLRPNGAVVLVNWTGQSDDPCTGDEAAELFLAHARPVLAPTMMQRQEGYRLDRLDRLGS